MLSRLKLCVASTTGKTLISCKSNRDFIGGNTKLASVVQNPLDIINNHSLVADFVNENGHWDFNKFAKVVPIEYLNKIRTVHPPSPFSGPDYFSWLSSLMADSQSRTHT